MRTLVWIEQVHDKGTNVLLSKAQLQIIPRSGEKFTIGGKDYTVQRVEHSISDEQHSICVMVR